MRRFRRNLRHACGIADARNHANTRREYQTNAWRRCGRCNEGVREDARGCDGREGGNPIQFPSEGLAAGISYSTRRVFHSASCYLLLFLLLLHPLFPSPRRFSSPQRTRESNWIQWRFAPRETFLFRAAAPRITNCCVSGVK